MQNATRTPVGSRPFKPRQRLHDLGEQISELAAHLDAAEYRFLVLLENFCDEKGWELFGAGSCVQWLNWRCGMSPGVAREKIRVARALPDLPKISQQFRQGKISYSKVRAMTRVATQQNEDVLLNVALHGTASHVEKQVQLYRRVRRIEALKKENERHAHRELSWRIDEDGYWIFQGRFTPEQGAVIRKALEKAQADVWEPEPNGKNSCDTGKKEPIAARRADSLQRVAETYLARNEADASGGDRYMINVHTDVDTLKADGIGAQSELENCCHVPAETSRRMACDASVVHWQDNAEGEPLNVGRKTRTIPPAIRRALHRRDQGCRFPGCTCTRFVDAHHVTHWADGGETCMDNLVLLCRRHHRLVHEGGYTVSMCSSSDQVEFTSPNGKVLSPCPEPRSRGNVISILRINRKSGLKITAETSTPRWRGERMDHGLAVLGLVQRE